MYILVLKSRISQDQQTVDVQIRMTTQMLLSCIFSIIGAVISIFYSTPYVAAVMLPIAFIYYRLVLALKVLVLGIFLLKFISLIFLIFDF
jgi:hypothetical protein